MVNWQLQLYEEVAARAPADTLITVHGSAADPSSLDGWSDLDLRLTLAGDLGLDDLLPVGVWAMEDVRHRAGQTCRTVLADGRRLDLSISGDGRLTGFAPAADNEFRFIAATAMARLGRGERLISTHLILQLWQLCLVEAMLLRDQDAGTDVHRRPTARDQYADAVPRLANGSWDPSIRPNVIERTADLYARWRGEREISYTADWTALQELIERGLS